MMDFESDLDAIMALSAAELFTMVGLTPEAIEHVNRIYSQFLLSQDGKSPISLINGDDYANFLQSSDLDNKEMFALGALNFQPNQSINMKNFFGDEIKKLKANVLK